MFFTIVSSLYIRAIVNCENGFFGQRCEVECSERNDDNAGYTCHDNGSILCRQGNEIDCKMLDNLY